MTDSLRIRDGLSLPISEIEIRASRSSGPGGQHANVTASRIEAVFDVQGSNTLDQVQKDRISAKLGPRVTAVAQDARSQARNRDLALERLARRLEQALHMQRPRTKTKPSAGAKRRRLEDKKRRAQTKQGRRRHSGED
ncbi:alternative ribosome rescue aminoacyl-tRNA hydrolase ArfB [Solirubrobacter phytolaccae]|uniref:Alternative ribosome rescue aminoacyl-tRNA hydrolase ArfB n=1 Tax=Solirubrobacter phytolaccae TaxID=1404360 RepID=A0A9X3NER6_9ACTN|nr:alternative ribosome rescue aminoacyl-tRNA hydrolase ArfB [Solirubrobacter phytolaccae]MDA0183607.1 alternative ribosome rescue aminoacyl-tRNA hydrolase ArfB [Solirubrobacter phytolaccae]